MTGKDGTTGITRRELLAGLGASAALAMIPNVASAVELAGSHTSDPRSVIFLVGDGMPLGVIRAMHEAATRVMGESSTAIYDLMSHRHTVAGYMGTASLSSIVTDSAPASAAWATGSKTNNGVLASLPDGTPLTTILELAKKVGIGTGLVTTTRVTHATPAAWVSHNTNRDDENNIAVDFFNFQPDVLLGGGKGKFTTKTLADFAAAGYDAVQTRSELNSLAVSGKKIVGLFNNSHMSYYLDWLNTPAIMSNEPTLAEMTTVALNKLSRNKKGFVLQVEAGRIDHAAHANDAWGSILDTYQMDLTLRLIRDFMRKRPNTLLIITSDHGNSGWGVNGTGSSYNDATTALLKYKTVTKSFEAITPLLKNKSIAEIKSIVAQHTGFNDLLDAEAQMIYDSLQPGFKHYPGDFTYLAETQLGRILGHSDYSLGIRRGNVQFTSNNHTAEDQLVLVHGKHAAKAGLRGYVDNTALFGIMCRHLNLKHKNPKMSAHAAAKHVKHLSDAAWAKSMEAHVR
ncbi:MAG TPA: alkaline phosphatase [Coriobacteriia bacterium]|nr:alkaline phosphatase [Coriobacteriia bacterium]